MILLSLDLYKSALITMLIKLKLHIQSAVVLHKLMF